MIDLPPPLLLAQLATWQVVFYAVAAGVIVVAGAGLVGGSERALLVRKYLLRKLAPLFAALAVTLCSAMVIIVISIMGGFLDMMRNSVRSLTSDVMVLGDMTGFPHYEELIEQIEAITLPDRRGEPQPAVVAATPIVRTYGLVKLHGMVSTVEVEGVDPGSYAQVTDYADTLYWTGERLADDLRRQLDRERAHWPTDYIRAVEQKIEAMRGMDVRQYGMTLSAPQNVYEQEPYDGRQIPGMVPGIEIDKFNRRTTDGHYDSTENLALFQPATLTVMPLTLEGGAREPAVGEFVVSNEYKSGLYDIDRMRVYVPFGVLQAMLDMQAKQVAAAYDEQTGEVIGEAYERPARASEVMIKAAPGVSAEALRDAVDEVAQAFRQRYAADRFHVEVITWRDKHATLLNAVEKEKFMVTFLFGVVSIVAFTMIAVIFYMIVLEKTRDIGTLRAIGASRRGIASIFLGYGLVIGIIGAMLGAALASIVVFNINEIQDFLARTVGFEMWNAQTYYFDRIPSQLNPYEVTWIVTAAVISSVLGALIPAVLASRLDPVEALRYE